MISLLLGSILLLACLLVFAISTLGQFRLGYVLNRFHAAATGETLGVALCCLGLLCHIPVSHKALCPGSQLSQSSFINSGPGHLGVRDNDGASPL